MNNTRVWQDNYNVFDINDQFVGYPELTGYQAKPDIRPTLDNTRQIFS